MKRTSPIIRFDLPAEDGARAAAFYESVFGWQMRFKGGDNDCSLRATTTESDAGGPKGPGAIDGSPFPKSRDRAGLYPAVTIEVEDIQEAIDRISQAGGRVLGDIIFRPGLGRFIVFLDPECNRVGVLQRSG